MLFVKLTDSAVSAVSPALTVTVVLVPVVSSSLIFVNFVPFVGACSSTVYTPAVNSGIITYPSTNSAAAPSTVADVTAPFSTVITTVLLTVPSVPGSVIVNSYSPLARSLVSALSSTVTFLVSFKAPLDSFSLTNSALSASTDSPSTVLVYLTEAESCPAAFLVTVTVAL